MISDSKDVAEQAKENLAIAGKLIDFAIVLAGITLVCVGFYQIYEPSSYIVGGALLSALGAPARRESDCC